MKEGSELVPFLPGDGYKDVRADMVRECIRLTNDVPSALEFMERWEKSVLAAVLLVQPDAALSRAGYEAAARAFIEN